jgi:hypothetical protein
VNAALVTQAMETYKSNGVRRVRNITGKIRCSGVVRMEKRC